MAKRITERERLRRKVIRYRKWFRDAQAEYTTLDDGEWFFLLPLGSRSPRLAELRNDFLVDLLNWAEGQLLK